MTRATAFKASCALTIGLALCFVARSQAHEMALARALATFDDGRFSIEILADPQSLLAQLAVRGDAGLPEPRESIPAVDAVRVRLPALASGIEVYFDDQRAAAAIDYSKRPSAALLGGLEPAALEDAGSIRLTGAIPPGASRFSMAYRWTYGAMALTHSSTRGAEPRVLWMAPGERSPTIDLRGAVRASTLETAREFVVLGFTHIIPQGLDHILFVLGLYLLGSGWRGLAAQVTAFTVAHTCTLALTMLGIVSMSPAIVEPLIALSIAYVAVENLLTTRLRTSRLALVFCFGLLHGMGFAGVLSELGFPAGQFVTAILSFNLGVEAGQLAVLGAAVLALAGWREASLLPLVARPASALIALGGLYWTIQRVVA